ncbi:MAG: hypothetical protein K6A34_06245 [Methanobrevibacter sp.]|nr:hypothetical protein [Methanobrevibacter sp.]
MTEKYTVKKWYDENAIYYKGEIFAIVDVRNQANKICDRLNELSTENEQLKSDIIAIEKRADKVYDENKQLKLENGEMEDYLGRLEEVNEELKQQLQNIQELFDNTIRRNEEAIEWGKNIGADVGAMSFHNEMLKQMKGDVE